MVEANTTCQTPMKTTSEGAWQGDDPLHFALPLLILQICLVVVVTRSLAFVLKPLHQPRVIAEIIVRTLCINANIFYILVISIHVMLIKHAFIYGSPIYFPRKNKQVIYDMFSWSTYLIPSALRVFAVR